MHEAGDRVIMTHVGLKLNIQVYLNIVHNYQLM